MISAILPKPLRQAFAPTLAALAAFALVASVLSLALRAASPPPEMLVLSPKLADYDARHDAFDTVVLGTSRTFYQVVPDTVEAGMAAAGCPGRSVYNFGVFGLRGQEMDWILDRILETPRPSLKTLVLEHPLEPHRKLDDVLNERGRFFSGPDHYAATLDTITAHPEIAPKKLFRAGVFAAGVAYDLSGVGRAAAAVFPAPDETAPAGFDFSEDGFEALDASDADAIKARNAAFRADPGGFDALLARHGAPRAAGPAADFILQRLGRVAQAGLTPIYFAAPSAEYLDLTPAIAGAVAERAPNLAVLNFNDPSAYPELFARGVWFDSGHLGRAGAEQFSFRFGEALCAAETGGSTSLEARHAVR